MAKYKCLRRILYMKWSDKVTNTTLWKWTKQLPIENEIKKRKWRWIGHTLRKPPETITRQAITWNPPGKRRRGRPRISGKETQKGKQKRWVTPGERWRRWPRTENSGVPWWMAYAPNEQTGVSKQQAGFTCRYDGWMGFCIKL